MNALIPLFDDSVYLKNGRPVVTSLTVARVFGKRHDNVVRAIKNLGCSDNFNLLNFEEVEYIDQKGELRQMIEMTYAGFCFLVMGFTGREADRWKEAFILKFEEMAEDANRKKYALPIETRIRLAKLDRPRICAPTTPQERDVMADLYRDGDGIRRVARKTGRAYSTVYGVIARSGFLRHRDDVTVA